MLPPSFLVQAFQNIPPEANENEIYGAWNAVLGVVFPLTEGYLVHPQYPVGGYIVTFTVIFNKATVFFVEIDAPRTLRNISARADADEQMRKRMVQLYESSPSEIRGISAFGTRIAFYELIKGDGLLLPRPAAEPSRVRVVDVAPETWWSLDVLTEKGWGQLNAVVDHVKALAQLELNQASRPALDTHIPR